MKKWLTFLSSTLSLIALAGEPVIYGVDNRKDTYQITQSSYLKLASATAARVHFSRLRIDRNNVFVSAPTLQESESVCRETRFALQQTAADCSGVLIAPDVIVTAGHCMMSSTACENYAWVFQYQVQNGKQQDVTVKKRDVYACEKLLKINMSEGFDYALVKLDQEVSDVTPVKVAKTLPTIGTKVVTIGNPSGLPQKITDGAEVKETSKTEFKANIDTFNKGSGSPVFHAGTGELLGILVRGEKDYVKDMSRGCFLPNVISDSSAGEDISSSIQFLKAIKPKR